MNMYVIKHKSLITGNVGEGSPTTKALAERWVHDMNAKYAGVAFYWMEPFVERVEDIYQCANCSWSGESSDREDWHAGDSLRILRCPDCGYDDFFVLEVRDGE